MAATEVAPQTQDIPFTVQDRRKKGFFTIDNDLLDQHGAELGPYGLAVYMALARFADQDSECFPSQSTIAKRTGMSRMQVSREVEKLKHLKLIAVEQQFRVTGAKSSNLYILLDTPHVTDSDMPCNSELQPHVTDSDMPCNSELHKQNIENKTYKNKTKRTTVAGEERDNNNSGGETDRKKDVVVALTGHGMAEGVAARLADHYSRDRVFEKLEYLEYLQEVNPDKVQAPTGWLRRAIEENYGAPDGFVSREARERLAAEEERQAQEGEARALAAEQERQAWHAKIQAEREAAILQMQAEYGATEEDRAFWEQAQQEFQYVLLSRQDIAAILREAWILKVEQEVVAIGVSNEAQWRQLQHPGTQKMIERALGKVAGRKIGVKTEVIGRPTA